MKPAWAAEAEVEAEPEKERA
eukprot:COSAG01_NODE_37863_length_497_cov_51.027638_1_plen_20_part_10